MIGLAILSGTFTCLFINFEKPYPYITDANKSLGFKLATSSTSNGFKLINMFLVGPFNVTASLIKCALFELSARQSVK